MDNNIFNDNNNNPSTTGGNEGSTTTAPEASSFLDQLVGEGRKFKDVESLARGKAEADRYVDQLRTELETQRQLNEEKLDKLLEAITAKDKGTSSVGGVDSGTGTNFNDNRQDTRDATSPDTTSEDIESLVKRMLSEREQQQSAQSNLATVDSKMKEIYGEKAGEVLITRSNELGISREDLKRMAETSPTAFLKLMSDSKSTSSSSFSSTPNRVNTTSLGVNNNSNERGWSYYRDLKKRNPREFWNRHQEMGQLIEKVGREAFYNS